MQIAAEGTAKLLKHRRTGLLPAGTECAVSTWLTCFDAGQAGSPGTNAISRPGSHHEAWCLHGCHPLLAGTHGSSFKVSRLQSCTNCFSKQDDFIMPSAKFMSNCVREIILFHRERSTVGRYALRRGAASGGAGTAPADTQPAGVAPAGRGGGRSDLWGAGTAAALAPPPSAASQKSAKAVSSPTTSLPSATSLCAGTHNAASSHARHIS